MARASLLTVVLAAFVAWVHAGDVVEVLELVQLLAGDELVGGSSSSSCTPGCA